MIFGVRYAKNCLHRQWNSLIFPEIDLFCQNGRCCFDRHAKTRSGLCAFFALRYVPRFPEKARRLSRSADVLPYCGEKPVRNKVVVPRKKFARLFPEPAWFLMAPKKNFPLRLDPNIYRALEQWASEEIRSVNGHIEYLLREALVREKRIKKDGSSK